MAASKHLLVDQLMATISLCSRHPDLPFWGEVFSIVHELKKTACDGEPLYEIDPVGDVIYDHGRRRFIVRVPEMNIIMQDFELVDSIVKLGLFHPKKSVLPAGQNAVS
jgi:hypothetical protein